MLQLNYHKDHLSITRFNAIKLPDFTVLTGVNGSGKSHFLEAIENGSIVSPDLEEAKIVRFDYRSFYLDNEAVYNAQQIISDKNSAWEFFNKNNVKKKIEDLKNQLETSYAVLKALCLEKDKNFLELTKKDIGDDTVHQQYDSYKKKLRRYFNKKDFKNNQQALGIMAVCSRLPYSLDDIPQDEFFELFRPHSFKNDFLPQQLGKVIWDYYVKLEKNNFAGYRNDKYSETRHFLTDDEFIKIHGEKPWEIINKILKKFNSIDYRVPSPEGKDHLENYEVKLVHSRKKQLSINFDTLSSGEKVLMALIASIYKADSDKHFPDLLLLDEIDASLHPSMIKNLIEAINEIFLQHGTKVILVTHSPTTIALAPEESVFVMNKEGESRVEKKSKSDALSILTEGYATLEEGVRIFDEISKKEISILSEGNNVNYIKKSLELNGINDVEVVTSVDNISGKEQLRTIFDFLSKIEHRKKVIIVWDCDAQKYASLPEINNTYPFVFANNDTNKLAKKGIENLFDESLFEGFVKEISLPGGQTIREFYEDKKKDLEQVILGRNDNNDFKNFLPLIEKIKGVKK